MTRHVLLRRPQPALDREPGVTVVGAALAAAATRYVMWTTTS